MTWEPLPKDSKAAEVWLDFIDDRETKYFLLEGAVRSTKTYGSILAWSDYIENFCPKGPVAMIGNTRDTLIRNVIMPMQELLGPKYIQLNRGTSTLTLFGRQISLIGAPNLLAIKKLQGAGFVAVYADEAETYPKDVWQMLGTRTDAQGMKIIATFNPGPPNHYLKKDYIDRIGVVNGKHWHFTLDDNPFMPEKRKAELRAQYTGLWYKRYILGLWVAAEGAIYDMFDEAKHVLHGKIPSLSLISTGVDYGTANPTAFESCGYIDEGEHKGKWLFFKEFYHDPSERHQKTDAELSKDMQEYLRDVKVQYINVDPSAASFKLQLKRDLPYIIQDADNAVLDGIRAIASAISQGKLLVHESCTHLIEQMQGYVWDPKAQEKGEDRPIKIDDHALDAARYAFKKVSGINII